MPRYIDAEKFRNYAIEHKPYYANPNFFEGFNDVLRMIADEVCAPTADVQEVKHGEWKDDQDDVYWGNYIVKKHCSRCGYTPNFDRKTELFDLTKYCPNCGAKMDGEADD